MALPSWVRGRGLAVFVTIQFAATTLGSTLWGQLASLVGLPAANIIAAGGGLVALPLLWHWKLQSGAGVDLTPSMHWPTPVLRREADFDRGPALITVETA